MKEEQAIKCLVWDLDHTLWDGTLLEGDRVALRDGVVEALEALDGRGILQSVASKNHRETAMARLAELGVDHYFLYPQIHFGPKSASIQEIAKALNIGVDTFGFIDDQPFEREEVRFALPAVRCFDALELPELLAKPDLNPRFVTEDSRLRRSMYLADIERKRAEEELGGPSERFLATLDMTFRLAPATVDDLQRAEELTLRTNQLNTTGYTFSYDELHALLRSKEHLLLIASLEDRFGTYGKIGLALVEKGAPAWSLELLLMSCRVMSRGVGTVMLSHVMSLAKQAGAKLRAKYLPNGKNRQMLITYRFTGFKEVEKQGELAILEHDLTSIPPFPAYLKVDA